MVVFHTILRCNAIIGHTGLIQDVNGAGLLKQGIADVLLVGQNLLTVSDCSGWFRSCGYAL